MSDGAFPDSNPVQPSGESQPTVVVQAAQLFHGQREVCIEHEGVRYRLRITRRGKLILQK